MPKLAARSLVVLETGQTTWYKKLAGINQHHVWSTLSHDRDNERLDEHGLVSLPQAAVLIDQGRRDWTQFKLEDIGYINAAQPPHD